MTTQPSSTGPLGDELRQLLRLIEDVPAREPEPQREATIIPARTLERHRPRDDANRRPAGERAATANTSAPPVPPALQEPPDSGRSGMRVVSMVALGLAGAAVVAGWLVFGQRSTSTSALAGNSTESTTATVVAQIGPPLRSANAPATHSPNAAPVPNGPTSAVPVKPNLTLQPITMAPQERARFLVRVDPITVADNAFIRVQGLPQGATLNRGRAVAPDAWVVPAGDLAALELTLGNVGAGRFDIIAELQTDRGRALAQAKSQLVVNARAAAPAPAPATGREFSRSGGSAGPSVSLGDAAPDVNAEKFLAQGLRLLLAGSVNSARLMLQRAADAGDANAALILGDTYDEVRLSQLGVQGVVADRDRANFWYGRADELGAPEAKDRLSEINSR